MIGQTLNHYKIVARLGRGGMGEVYAAEDAKLGRRVALKLLPAALAADAERRARLEREARAVATLTHPNIVTVYSVEQAGDVHFITMELVEGKTLTEALRGAGLPLSKLLDYAVTLADAVTAAHRKGITHRDLKPDNVMLSDDGRLKVLDFGLAKLQDGTSLGESQTVAPTQTVTQEGKILGTVAYMAPEQAEGKPADARSDVFSLGVVLYQRSTGDRPFKGDTPISTITSILRDTPTSITELNRSLPRHLGRIVRRCLEKDPELRYQTAQDLRNDLQGLRSELESGDLQVSDVAVAAASRRPRRTWPIVALGVVAIVAVAFAMTLFTARRGNEVAASLGTGAKNMEIQRLTASGDSREAIISADGRYVVYIVEDAGEVGMWVTQVSTSSKVEILPAAEIEIWDPTFSPDGDFIYFCRYEDPGPPDLYRVPSLGGSARKVMEHVNGRVSFSPDGRRFVFLRAEPVGEESTLVIAGIDGTNPRVLATAQAPSSFDDPVWSPDGKTIAASRITFDEGIRATVGTLPIEGGAWTALTDRTWLGGSEIAWLPDGSGLVINADTAASTQLWEVGYPDGRVGRVTNDLNSYHGVSLTADGETLATVLNEATFNLWTFSLEPGVKPERLTSAKTNDGIGIDWTPDGRLVFGSAFGGKPDLWIVDADGSNRAQLTREESNMAPQVSNDGRYVVFMSNRAGTVNVWRMNLDGGNLLRLTNGSLDVDPSLTPDGKWAIYLDPGSGKLFRVSIDGGEPVEIRAARGGPGEVSPDGKLILTGSFHEEAGRWQTEIIPFEGGEPIATFHEKDADTYRWTPDGDLAYVKTEGGVGNLWTRPLKDGKAVQLTHFDADGIQSFAWSRDGKRLAVSRGKSDSDIVLLKHFR